MCKKGTLDALGLWFEKAVGRANLNEHEKQIFLCLKYRPDYPDTSTTLSGGGPV